MGDTGTLAATPTHGRTLTLRIVGPAGSGRVIVDVVDGQGRSWPGLFRYDVANDCLDCDERQTRRMLARTGSLPPLARLFEPDGWADAMLDGCCSLALPVAATTVGATAMIVLGTRATPEGLAARLDFLGGPLLWIAIVPLALLSAACVVRQAARRSWHRAIDGLRADVLSRVRPMPPSPTGGC